MRVQITRVDDQDVVILPDDLAASLGFDRTMYAEATVLPHGSMSVRSIMPDNPGPSAAGAENLPTK